MTTPKEIREAAGISRYRMAKILRRNESTLRWWETDGIKKATFDHALKLYESVIKERIR